MIEVQDLTKRFGSKTAVDQLSFRVDRGEIVGFLGPNGAGKSTTLRMVTGYVTPTAGTISVDGIDALASPIEARKRLGYMPEGVPLYPEMRVREYLRYRAKLKGVPGASVGARVDRALEQAAITDVDRRIIGQLSKGYRQRVGLADALVADPPLLVLDEPTAGLDPHQIRQVRELIRGFAGDKTVFLSTHILSEVEATCTRVVIIHQGKIVGEGTPETLRAKRSGQVVRVVVRAEKEAALVEKDGYREAPARGEPAVFDPVPLLTSVEGVVRASEVREVQPRVFAISLETESGDEVMERIAARIAAEGLALRELRSDAARLEDVFVALTTTDDAEPARAKSAGDEEQESEDEEEESEDEEEESEDEEEESEDEDEESEDGDGGDDGAEDESEDDEDEEDASDEEKGS